MILIFHRAILFVVLCDTQEAIDQYWHALGHDGQFEKCGWLRDKFGVSWQIIAIHSSILNGRPNQTGTGHGCFCL